MDAEIPVPNGHSFAITGLHAVGESAEKIIIEAVCLVIRPDRVGEDDDTAPTDVKWAVIAVFFPKVQPFVELRLAFSILNLVSVRATGGPVMITGLWHADQSLQDLSEMCE
jgi:hypothetical protein